MQHYSNKYCRHTFSTQNYFIQQYIVQNLTNTTSSLFLYYLILPHCGFCFDGLDTFGFNFLCGRIPLICAAFLSFIFLNLRMSFSSLNSLFNGLPFLPSSALLLGMYFFTMPSLCFLFALRYPFLQSAATSISGCDPSSGAPAL